MKGKNLDEQTIYNIMSSYALTKNFSETARNLNMAISTVRDTVHRNMDKAEYVELREQKKEEFADKASKIINKLLTAVDRKADALLDDETLKNTRLTDITTSIGTLFDKRALALGESTDNITFTLPDEVKKYAE